MDSLNPYSPFKGRKKGSPFTQEQLDYIYQLVQQGWTANRIGREFKIDRDNIRKRIKENNWVAGKKNRNSFLSNKELQEIKQLVDNGLEYDKICKEFQISQESLLNRIVNNKWQRGKRSNSYSFNEKYFDSIDDEHKAYWLGFLMADGYILSKRNGAKKNESQSFGFSISMKDKELFEYFKKDLSAENPVNVYKSSGYNTQTPAGRILLTSQYTVNQLKKHGIVENKTFITKMPNISKELIPAFIRGYSDGDGSIIIDKNNKYQWNLTGTKELLTQIQFFLHTNLKLSQRWPERNNNCYTLKYFGNIQVPNLLDIIYKDQTICLKRKYNKYAEMRGI